MNLNVLKAMSPRGKLMLGASALGVVLVAFLLFSLASKPSYSTIAAGIDPSQTGKMTAALDTQGIKYQLANNGTALEVQAGQEAQARVALATQGLLGPGTGDAWANFDKQQLGASDFQQQVSYQRALEQQIAQTIDQIPGAGTSSVQLTMPKDQLFTNQQTPATAAVLLGAGSTSLDPTAVRGIANLVASSVPNLKPSNVTITDSSGQMVWPSGDTSGFDGSGGGASKPAAEARYNAQLESQLNAIVDRTLGPGKANVQVQSDLNVDSTSRDSLQYANKGTPLHTTKDLETLRGGGAGGAGGAAGAAANIPTYAGAAGGAGGNSNYSHNQSETDFGVGKVVTHTKVAPGAVNRLDVALVVDPSVPPRVRNQLQQAIATAAGIQRSRGDTISTSIVPFTQANVTGVTTPGGGIMGYAKYAVLGLASLIFLFFVGRHLRRRESADLVGEPVWLRQVESPRPLAELSSPARQDPPTEAHDPVRSPGRQQVEAAVQRDPERVAQTLRAWMEDPA